MSSTSAISTSRSSNELRHHSLDALRALALLLGVLLHASMSFLPNSEYFWLVHDPVQSELLGPVFFSIHVFRMPLFFLLAGFFAYIVLKKKGQQHLYKIDFVALLFLCCLAGR